MAAKAKGSKKASTKRQGKDRLKRAGTAGRDAAAKIGQAASDITKAAGDALGHVLPSRPALSPELLAELEPRIREIVREELAAGKPAESSAEGA
jgi:hypothetical protein